jgi:5'-3' exonuclease
MKGKGGGLWLVDASPLVFRAYFALPDSVRDKDGRPAHAIHGFLSSLNALFREWAPSHVAVAFDGSLTTSFRNDLYPAYKAQRVEPPESLVRQISTCIEAARGLGARTFIHDRYEADDLLATLAFRHAGEAKVVVTPDKDLAQLEDPRTRFFDPRKTELMGEDGVRQTHGVRPGQIVDLLGLAGDPVDNIPGIKGIGRKTAVALLEAFANLEEIYADLRKVEALALRGARRVARKLEAGRDTAFLSRKLATLVTDIELERADLESLRWRGPDPEILEPLLDELGFEGMKARLLPGEARRPRAS